MTMNKIKFAPINKHHMFTDATKPRKAKDFIPTWFRTMPHYMEDETQLTLSKNTFSTVRRCPSFHEVFSTGFVLVAPCDMFLKIQKDGKFNWETPDAIYQIDTHADYQFSSHYPNKNIKGVFKLVYPYMAITPKGYGCIQLPMLYHNNPDFYVPYGYLETDIYHELNPQIIVTADNIEEGIIIKQGTPLNYLIPYKKDKWDIEYLDYSEELEKKFTDIKFNLLGKFSGGFFKNIKR